MSRITLSNKYSVSENIWTLKDDGTPDELFTREDDEYRFLKRLQEYEDLEEQGKLLRLPVAVGDMVYVIFENTKGAYIDEQEVVEVSTERFWADSPCFDYSDIGKTVFLTREAAEAKLREMGRKADE